MLSRYPTKLQSRVKRSFQSGWFQQHDWLEYSELADTVFRYHCRHFSMSGLCSRSDVAFTIKGFSNWKKARYSDGGFASHCKSENHRQAYIAWKDFLNNDAQKPVPSMLTDKHMRQIKDNRCYISAFSLTCLSSHARIGWRSVVMIRAKAAVMQATFLISCS